MNRSLVVLVSLAVGLSALAAACSSETVDSSTAGTEPEATSSSGDLGDRTGSDKGGYDAPPDDDTTGDAGSKKADAGKTDSGSPKDAGALPFTKAEVQALFDARCAPCHVGGSSAGLSLANDFTATTVGIASTEVPGMKRIAPGDKDASYLFHKVRGTHQTVGGSGERMPRNGPPFLSASDIDRIGAFIDTL